MFITIIRTVLLYVLIVFAVRVMGKRQLSELQPSELVVTLIIADIASIPMEDNSRPLLSGMVPMLILVALEIIVSVLMMKKPRFRKIVCGSPVMIIEGGKLLQKEMKRLRITTEDLCVQLRQQGVFSLNDVEYCIAETNGDLSVLQKPEKRNPSAEDLNIKIKDTGIETVIINDGEFLNNSLRLSNTNTKHIKKILKQENTALKDVFIMTYNQTGDYKIIKKDI
ncbi:MAG: DUF421 domain-containing protein [Ruminococcus sp.]|nr:DUF421 domain-containing protein [Ruminococcus sp.]